MPFVENISQVFSERELQPVYEQWQKLALTSHLPDPVCGAPVWNLSYHDVFCAGRRVFYLSGANSLLLFSESHAADGEIILTPMEDSWMFGRPLLGFYSVELLEEALDIFAGEYSPRFPVIVLSGIRENMPETTKLLVLLGRNFNFYRYQSTTQCFASLAGGMDGWLSRRSPNHRAKLKKASRRARDMGVVFERNKPATKHEAQAIYQRMLDVERRSWKGQGKCGMAESPSLEFYANLISRHAQCGSAWVIFARLDGRDIGFIFGGSYGTFYRGQQFSYDLDFAPHSIGNLMQQEKVRWLCEAGFTRYDMGPITGPRMGYKEHWTEGRVVSQAWIMRGL